MYLYVYFILLLHKTLLCLYLQCSLQFWYLHLKKGIALRNLTCEQELMGIVRRASLTIPDPARFHGLPKQLLPLTLLERQQ